MGVSNNITTLYGWAEQGERAYAEQAGFATERVNIVAGYNAGTKELIAPLEHSGYMDKQLFTQWICDHLCPALTKGQHVIMDNASIHKDIKIKEAIESIEKYSPELLGMLPKDSYHNLSKEDNNKVLNRLLRNFNDIPTEMKNDIFGEISKKKQKKNE